MASANIEAEGVLETIAAFKQLETALERKEANAKLRAAAKECAGGLALALRAAAAGAATPVAARVATSIKVKSDRFPVVSIGGPKKVGRTGAPAELLMWGSEQGGSHFGAAEGGQYWIAPTVETFGRSAAPNVYRRALYDLLKEYELT